MSAAFLFDEAVFDDAIFDVGISDPQLFPIIRDWYLPRKSWKKEREELAEAIRQQRIALGILPDEMQGVADAALVKSEAVLLDDQSAASFLLAALETRELFINAYPERDSAAQLWDMELEMRQLIKRRRNQITLLLLSH